MTSIGTVYNIFKKYEISQMFLSRAESIYQATNPTCEAYGKAELEFGKSCIELKQYKDTLRVHLLKSNDVFDKLK